MPTTISTVDLRPILARADRTASQLCRNTQSHLIEQDDVRQDLLLDLLIRLKRYDAARGGLQTFAAICFQHRAARHCAKLRSDHKARHPAPLDAMTTGDVTLIDCLADVDGYGAWIGQPTDDFADIERRLDLDRALSALSDDALAICAALLTSDIHPAATAGLSRTTLHRRVQDLRCRLLAAGIGIAVEQPARPVSK